MCSLEDGTFHRDHDVFETFDDAKDVLVVVASVRGSTESLIHADEVKVVEHSVAVENTSCISVIEEHSAVEGDIHGPSSKYSIGNKVGNLEADAFSIHVDHHPSEVSPRH